VELDTVLGIGLLVATGVLAWATWGLWRTTTQFVNLTRDSLAVVESASAPRLILNKDGRGSIGDTHMEGRIQVENVGGGVAHSIVLITSWGEATAGNPVLRPSEKTFAGARITNDEWAKREGGEDQDPVPQRVRFLDAQGRAHEVEAREHVAGSTWVATVWPSTP